MCPKIPVDYFGTVMTQKVPFADFNVSSRYLEADLFSFDGIQCSVALPISAVWWSLLEAYSMNGIGMGSVCETDGWSRGTGNVTPTSHQRHTKDVSEGKRGNIVEYRNIVEYCCSK